MPEFCFCQLTFPYSISSIQKKSPPVLLSSFIAAYPDFKEDISIGLVTSPFRIPLSGAALNVFCSLSTMYLGAGWGSIQELSKGSREKKRDDMINDKKKKRKAGKEKERKILHTKGGPIGRVGILPASITAPKRVEIPT